MSHGNGYRVIEKENGNFDVVLAAPLTPGGASFPVFRITKQDGFGWKVRTNNSARRSSKTFSATPEEAASKYFRKKLDFEYQIVSK